MKTVKKVLAFILVLAMVCGFLPSRKAEAAASGTLSLSVERDAEEKRIILKLTADNDMDIAGLHFYLRANGVATEEGEIDYFTLDGIETKFTLVSARILTATPMSGFKTAEGRKNPAFEANFGRKQLVAAGDTVATLTLAYDTFFTDTDYVFSTHVIEAYNFDEELFDFPDRETVCGEYTVRFINDDETEISSAVYPYGTPAADIVIPDDPSKEATPQYSYSFAGWTPEFRDVTEPATYTATYTAALNRYTVKFVDENGTTVLGEARYDYGTPAADIARPADPEKPADVQYSYSFAGWTPEIAAVTGDATYTATYTATLNKYTVTFVDEDGSVLKEAKAYDYGTPASDIETPAAPTKQEDAQYTYEFAGWDPELAAVTANVVYKATYEAISKGYLITVTDHTKGKAAADLVADQLYKGEVSFTISADEPCLAAVREEDGTYTRLTAANTGNTHTYTVTVTGPMEIAIVVKGDVNLDASVSSRDSNQISKHLVGTANPPLSALQLLVADVNEDGSVTSKDSNKISKFLVERDSFAW